MTGFLSRILHSLRHQKLSQDIAWTLGSFGALAVSGIIVNIAIAAFRDASALGIFNLSYAVYIVAAQFAVWGVHYSVLRHASYHENSQGERGAIFLTACLCVVFTGMIASIAVNVLEPVFAQMFHSQETARAITNASLGLVLFPLNKVLLNYLNGLRRMKAYSVLQGLRYIVVTVLVAGVAATDMPIATASYCFFIAEAVTAVLALAYIASAKLVSQLDFTRGWVETHYRFGTKALAAGMFTEVNARIDVLLVGFFMTPAAAGIYSFAAMLVDGLYHVLAMIRINFNPMLVAALRDQDHNAARDLRVLSRKYVLPAVAVLGAGLILAYYILAAWIIPQKGMMEGFPTLLILLAGVTWVSFLVPFDNLMLISGHPGYQTMQQLAAVGANILVAALLIPLIGIEGAAIGTAISYAMGIFMLVVFARKLISWDLLANRFTQP